jgi:hypothetical protein
VSGDVCVNLLEWRTHNQSTKGLSWQYYPYVHSVLKNGEALLLSKLVALSTGASILSPQIQDIEGCLQEEALVSTVELELFPIINDDRDADMVILDDENNGFNSNEKFWPLALRSQEISQIIIYRINSPNSSSTLWKHIEEFHIENTIVVINGDALCSKGVNISRGLSWERTALDFVWQMNNNPNCQACWYIIKDKSSTNLAEIAYDIVKNGEKSALRFIPIAQFGNLKVVDRTEIESYRSIKNLMSEYVSTKNAVRPLSIAVFGTPGSGKSFGVTEVASSIAPTLIEKLNFNLSQFQSVSDLTAAFHRVRDLSLHGKLLLVFFDEFDSDFEGKLGWLKYFLAPMQDGVFREGDSIHPIGKAIFVFAGGTSSTFKEFCGEDISDKKEYKHFFREFQSTRGPDFISRLRSYVNILGPNQTDEHWDQLFIIRRAMLLRSLLERKTPHLINDRGEAQIDNGVLRALLKVARYKHEARSMEAILEMSTLTNAKKWEQSHLPSKEQLKLHVDEEEFLRHLMQDTFFSEKIEKLAAELHYAHKTLYKEEVEPSLSCMRSWEEVGEEYKNSTCDKVRHIPNALHKINYDIISVKEKPETIEFTERELNILAEYEHKRWSLQKKE